MTMSNSGVSGSCSIGESGVRWRRGEPRDALERVLPLEEDAEREMSDRAWPNADNEVEGAAMVLSES